MSDIRQLRIGEHTVDYDADMPIGVLEDLEDAASEGGGLKQVREGLSAFVTAWTYGGEPSNPDAWRNLRRSQFQAITEAILADLTELGNE